VATAHPQLGPATINRYARLVLTSPDRARLFYTAMIGDIPALRLRQSVDADRSGQLDQDEQATLQAQIAAQVRHGILLQAGESQVPLTWELAQLSLGDASVSARGFSLDAQAITQPLPAQTAAVQWRYQDRVALAPAGENELRVEEAPGVWLRASRGPAPPPGSPAEPQARAAPARLFQLYAPGDAPPTLQVELDVAAQALPRSQAEANTRPGGPARRAWLLGLALIGALAIAAARWATRRSASAS
jgi:hypothetical protein